MNEAIGPFTLVLLALPGTALLVVARTMYGRTTTGRASEMQQAVRMAGILLIVLALLGAVVGLVGWLSLFGLPLAVIVLRMIVDRYRRGEHQSLLYVLAASARRGIPLSVAARAFAAENSGDTSTRALALAEKLEQGLPLKEAARAARLKLSTASRLALNLGESLGDLGQVLGHGLETQQRIDHSLQSAITRFAYILLIPQVGIGLLAFLMLKIVPVFAKMFEEFGLKLPAMTALLVNVSKQTVSLGSEAPLVATLVGTALAGMLLAVAIVSILYFGGWFPKDVPFINLLLRRYDGALVMLGLASCVERQMPLHEGLGVIARAFPRRSTGRVLELVAHQTAQGQNWCEGLRRNGLISAADTAVLHAAERAGNLSWALQEMADRTIRRQVDRLQLRSQILFPILILLFGGCVGFVVIALFLPIVSLIQGLS